MHITNTTIVIWGEKNKSILMNTLQVLENKTAKIILGQQRYFLNQSFRRTKMDKADNEKDITTDARLFKTVRMA